MSIKINSIPCTNEIQNIDGAILNKKFIFCKYCLKSMHSLVRMSMFLNFFFQIPFANLLKLNMFSKITFCD